MFSKFNSDKLLFINTISIAFQVFTVSISYFIIYKLIINTFGEVMLGIWSLIVATSSIANITSLGFSNGILKFIANFSSKNDYNRIKSFIQTAYLSVSILFFFVTLIIYLLSIWFLEELVPRQFLADASSLMKWSLVCFWLNGVNSIFLSAIDGLQLIYLRNILIIISTIILVFLSYFLKKYGIVGIAYAQVIQSILLIVGNIVLLAKRLKTITFLNFSWDKSSFFVMFNYGGKIQIIGILSVFGEPFIKFLFSAIGDFTGLATYEMASRLVSQVRNLIVQSNQSIVPYVAGKYSISRKEIKEIYYKNLNILGLLAIPIIFNLIYFSPYISTVFLGKSTQFFNYTVLFLCLGWLVNIFSTPSYFIYLGLGSINNILKTHALQTVINVIGGIIFVYYIGSGGIILAIFMALTISSIFNIFSFIKYYRLKFRILNYLSEVSSVSILIIIQLCLVRVCYSYLNINFYVSMMMGVLLVILSYIIFFKWFNFGKSLMNYTFTIIKHANK